MAQLFHPMKCYRTLADSVCRSSWWNAQESVLHVDVTRRLIMSISKAVAVVMCILKSVPVLSLSAPRSSN
jgi:hypothetical protein